jgi:YD repeat-containing protein
MSSTSRVWHLTLVVCAFTLILLYVTISLVLADVTYTYYPNGRVNEVCNTSSGQAVKYNYDSDGNILAVSPTNTVCPTPTSTP